MKKTIATVILIVGLGLFNQAFAHEGEDHAEAPGTEGRSGVVSTVTLSDTAINNLGIQTVKAAIAPRATSVDVNGIVEFLPERQAIVTSRAAGRVSEIHIKVGEKVNKGQSLLTIQPIFVGSSPVSIPSPITGYVTKQSVVLGQSVTPEAALMEVGESSEVLVRGVMYETPDVTKIQVGQNVRVTSSLLGSDSLLGKVQRMDGAAVMGNITVTKDGKPFAQLEPVMGAFAHVVGFTEDYNSVLHIHPMGKEPTSDTERGGPKLEFHIEPKTAGFVKLFAQVRIDGKDVFAPFGVTVK